MFFFFCIRYDDCNFQSKGVPFREWWELIIELDENCDGDLDFIEFFNAVTKLKKKAFCSLNGIGNKVHIYMFRHPNINRHLLIFLAPPPLKSGLFFFWGGGLFRNLSKNF